MSADMRHFLLLPTLLFPAAPVEVRYTVLGSPSRNRTYILLLSVETHAQSCLENGLNFRWQYSAFIISIFAFVKTQPKDTQTP